MMRNIINKQETTDKRIQNLESRTEETTGMLKYVVGWIEKGARSGEDITKMYRQTPTKTRVEKEKDRSDSEVITPERWDTTQEDL